MTNIRDDQLSRVMDGYRPRFQVSTEAAETIWQEWNKSVKEGENLPTYLPVSGSDIANTYGLLAHYTTEIALELIALAGHIKGGCWLTPTSYAACMVPYNLGLNHPCEICLLLDVCSVPEMWGPGTIPPSRQFPTVWQGRGIEFYVPRDHVIPVTAITARFRLRSCGGTHS